MNIVQPPRLHKVFFILMNELKKSDIPAHSTIRNHIVDKLSEHLERLGDDMKVKIICWVACFYLKIDRNQLGKSHLPQMSGLIPTLLHSWVSQPTGLKEWK